MRGYNTPVTIEQPTVTVDPSTGSQTITWTVYAQAFARVHVLAGREYLAEAELRGERTYRLELHQMPGIVNTMRVRLDDGTVMRIVSVIMDYERGIAMTLICREVVGVP